MGLLIPAALRADWLAGWLAGAETRRNEYEIGLGRADLARLRPISWPDGRRLGLASNRAGQILCRRLN